MAARRVTKTSVNWSALAERVPSNQRTNFTAFKTKSDKYLRSVMANPETPPTIDWALYKKRINIPGLVDTFQKHYDALKVPYPADNVTAAIDGQGKQIKSEVDRYVKESNDRICSYQKEIQYLQSLLPYDQMTMEDYRDSFPDDALDPINRPTYWPHTPEEQLGYKPADPAQSAH